MRPFLLITAFFLCTLRTPSLADAQLPGTEGVTAVFGLGSRLAAFDPQAGKLTLFEAKGEGLVPGASAAVGENVWQVAETSQGYLVATGVGRYSLSAPIQLRLFSKDLSSSRVVFQPQSERAEVTFLSSVGAKVWVAFFDSKYTTKIGFLTPASSGLWPFTEVASLRLGTAVDVRGDLVVVGRPYGDEQGQDGDLLLFRNGARETLPSYRGVRSVRFFGDAARPSIAIGDGWHQNYGQFAQGRLSILSESPSSGRYALELIDRDESQYSFSKIFELPLNGKRHLVALGPKAVDVYGPEGEWKRHQAYSRPAEDTIMDAAPLAADGGKTLLVVADKGLRVVAAR